MCLESVSFQRKPIFHKVCIENTIFASDEIIGIYEALMLDVLYGIIVHMVNISSLQRCGSITIDNNIDFYCSTVFIPTSTV